jgi:hypothetical protein
MKYTILIFTLSSALSCSAPMIRSSRVQASVTSSHFVSCPNDPERQKLRSAELQKIVKADQADRQVPGDQIDWDKVAPADEARAKRIAEIFAEGCFKTALDYAAAALVFQHGVVLDHYYQAYLWTKESMALGADPEKYLMVDAIDRYLISLGYKQLFGAQSYRSGPNGCHCIASIEEKFSERNRVRVCGISLKDRIISLQKENQANSACQDVLYCDKDLKSPPKGIFPGIW